MTKVSDDAKLRIVNKNKGISVEPYLEVLFNKKLSLKGIVDLDPLLEKYELSGSTMKPDGSGIEIYNVSVYNRDYDKHIKNAKGYYEELYGRGLVKGYTESTIELRSIAYTTKDGLTTYKRISGKVRIKPAEEVKKEVKELKLKLRIKKLNLI